MALAVVLSILAIVALVGVFIFSAAHVVPEGQTEAVYVRGELQGVVGPGVHMLPPFFTSTYPIDPSSMEVVTDDGTEPVPPEFRRKVEIYAEDYP